MAPTLRLPSFAKINWILRVLGRRADGYHELRTVYQTIDLRDEISLELTDEPGIQLEVTGRSVAAGPENLVYRAAELVRAAVEANAGFSIRLHKRIPVGGGLGGGSGNAAVTLLAANQLLGDRLSRRELLDLARRLGADVPLFLLGGTIIGVGRGDVLSKLGDILPTQWLLVVCPRLEIPTPHAYALGQWGVWDEADTLTREELENTIWRFCETAGSEGPEWSWVENDFEGPIFEHYPSLAEIRDRLLRLGCERVLLCGSGGALAAFAPPDRLRRVAEAVVKVESAETVLCRTLSRSEYLTALRECGLQAD